MWSGLRAWLARRGRNSRQLRHKQDGGLPMSRRYQRMTLQGHVGHANGDPTPYSEHGYLKQEREDLRGAFRIRVALWSPSSCQSPPLPCPFRLLRILPSSLSLVALFMASTLPILVQKRRRRSNSCCTRSAFTGSYRRSISHSYRIPVLYAALPRREGAASSPVQAHKGLCWSVV